MGTFYENMFAYYDSLVIEDTIPNGLTYKAGSASFKSENSGSESTALDGTLTDSNGVIRYTFADGKDGAWLWDKTSYHGQDIVLSFSCTVDEDYTASSITNTAHVIPNGDDLPDEDTIPLAPYMSVKKESANPSMTDNNGCYSLEGAVYGVYASESDANNDNNRLHTLTTDKNGETEAVQVAADTYYVKELERSEGFKLDTNVYSVKVTTDNTKNNVCVTTSAEPAINDPGGITLYKQDADTGEPVPQGDADLAGAQFTVEYYDGYYETESALPSSATRTWVLETKLVDGEYIAGFSDTYKVSGDDWYYNTDGVITLPLGTYVIYESKAPEGYLINGTLTDENGETKQADEKFISVLRDEDDAVWITGGNIYDDGEPVIRGGIELQKRDTQTLRDYPEGGATFEGATFTVTNMSERAVVVEGVSYEPGEVVATLVTDEDGYVCTSNDLLPYGTYLIEETIAPEGYLLGNDETHDKAIEQSVTSITVEIREDGKIYNLTGDTTENGESYIKPDETITDLVKRGDVSFVKQDGENQSTDMGSIPFRITSQTTGESHVIWTDANGDYSSDSTWNKHTYNTNAGTDEYDGLWFYGYDDAEDTGESTVGTEWRTEQVDDNLGALPYDIYDMDELPCEANEGYNLVHTSFIISRDIRTISLGTIDNYKYVLDTSATDAATGSHEVTGETIHDLVLYANLTEDEDYTLVAKLYDTETHEMVTNEDGEEVAFEHSITTHATTGTAEVSIDFDAEALDGHTLVVYEYLYDADGELLFAEEDPDNEEQTVNVTYTNTGLPLTTSMVNNWTGEHQATVFENHNIDFTDTVTYTGLTPGKTYVVRGTLMDKDTGEPMLDANDEEVHSDSEPFVAEEADGEVTVDFDFFAFGLHGTYAVAYEYLYEVDEDGNLSEEPVASHTDIDDAEQTVQMMKPTLWTYAIDTLSGEKQIDATSNVDITDMLDLTDLIIGHTYYVYGKAVDQEGNQIYDATTGEPVELYIEFVADAEEMELDIMRFQFDATGLDGQAVVFEEYLYADPDRTILITEEEDLGSAEETILFNGADTIGLTTELTDDLTGSHTALPSEHTSLTDAVSYEGVTPGETYTVKGTLMDKATGTPITDEDGNEVTTASEAFTPEDESGTITTTFELNAFDLGGTDVVAYEALYDADDLPVSIHEDIDDEAQTVSICNIVIGTTATETGTGNKTVEAGDVSITDTVTYDNVIAGMDYTMTGYAVNPSTGDAIVDKNNEIVTASKDLTPDSASGELDMIFQFDASELDGQSIVFVEYLYQGDELVGYHYDLSDAGQTMTIENPVTNYTAPKTGVMGTVAAVIAAVAAGGAILFVRRRRIAR